MDQAKWRRIKVQFLVSLVCLRGATAPALAQRGDMNCDGVVSAHDISRFVEALLGAGSVEGCDISNADMNADGLIDGRDTQGFVARLLQGPCSGGATDCGGVCTNTAFDPMNCGGCGIVCNEPGSECCFGGLCQSCW